VKSILLKLVASASLKLGVAYALRIVISSIGALRGVLAEGNISDENRSTISAIIGVLIAVRDFLSKFGEIIGAPALPAYASVHAELEKLAQGLDKITDSL
jgi:histidyl-tRNA synthetase